MYFVKTLKTWSPDVSVELRRLFISEVFIRVFLCGSFFQSVGLGGGEQNRIKNSEK